MTDFKADVFPAKRSISMIAEIGIGIDKEYCDSDGVKKTESAIEQAIPVIETLIQKYGRRKLASVGLKRGAMTLFTFHRSN
jgi:hypothetical protein